MLDNKLHNYYLLASKKEINDVRKNKIIYKFFII